MSIGPEYSKQLLALAKQLTQLARDQNAAHLTEREARNIENLLLTRRLHTLNQERGSTDRRGPTSAGLS